MALTINRDLDHYVDQELRTLPVAAAKRIFKGALVGLASTGHAQPLLAGNPFAGIAYEEMDNTTGAAGAVSVRVYTAGDFGHTLTGAAIGSVGRPVFASADDTLTFNGAGNTYVGTVQDVPATGQIILRIDPFGRRIKTVTHAVEDLAAGADISTRAIHSFEAEGWIVSARVINQGVAATGINDANTCVVNVTVDSGTVVTKVFDTANVFPAPNTDLSMGNLTTVRVSTSEVMAVSVTNGATANPGPFLIEVDYV